MSDVSNNDRRPAASPSPDAPSGGDPAKVIAIVIGVAIFAALGMIAYLLAADDDPEPRTASTTNPVSASAPSTSERRPTVDAGEGDELTDVQRRAAVHARKLLNFAPYSRSGLIQGVTDTPDESFSEADATIAVDSLHVDWVLQAGRAATSSLEFGAYSKPGLTRVLSESPNDFTDDQAASAVEALDVDWASQPQRFARGAADSISISRARLFAMMTDDVNLFEQAEAEKGIDDARIDFKKEAADAAEEALAFDDTITCDELLVLLSDEYGYGFTVAEATYGVGTTSAC